MNIVMTADGSRYCDECYESVCDPIRRESEFGLFRQETRDHGRCQCCGCEVYAGTLVDSGGESG